MKEKKTSKRVFKILKYLLIAVLFLLAVILASKVESPGFLQKVALRFLKLLLLVAFGCFAGSVLEYRSWHRLVTFIALPFTLFGRLPAVSGTALVTALVSNNAAGSMIAGSYSDGRISRLQMWSSAMCNSYIAMVSHSLRVAGPFIAALGLTGVIYYGITFGGGVLICLFFLVLSRSFAAPQTINNDIKEYDSGAAMLVLPWKEVFSKSFVRTKRMLLRLLTVTGPLYFAAAALTKLGVFKNIECFMPETLAGIISPELMTVLTARLGGMVNAAMVGKEFVEQHSMTYTSILLALVLGNIITNPLRLVRRNLPTALGVYGKDGAGMVFTLQFLRLIVMTAALLIILLNT